MLAKRIIPCLDIKDGLLVKGIQFRNHQIMGDILEYAKFYSDAGADELVFYDITASTDQRIVNKQWISKIASHLDIPFCVAGGIRTLDDARVILNSGADKISINSPALENPRLITELAKEFGNQCVVIGIDSHENQNDYFVYQYTGNPSKMRPTLRRTQDWIREVQDLGAGEIVLNCMNHDGVKNGYDIKQLTLMRQITRVPLIASGGAGEITHFSAVFNVAQVEGALAASVFHTQSIQIQDLKKYLQTQNIRVRL